MLDIQLKGNPVVYREAPCERKTFTVYNKAEGSVYDEVDGLDDNSLFRVAKEINSCSNTSDKIKKFERLVVIGDSLSDSEGRMLKKTSGWMPSAPQYYQGKFTNGSTWVDFISSPGFMNIAQVINKAEGGAVAGSYHKLTPSSSSLPSFLNYPVSWLLARFISNMNSEIKSLRLNEKDLVVVSIGSNDYMTFSKTDTKRVVSEQCENIRKMIKKGARNIIVMGIPDLSKTAAAKESNDQHREEIKNISLLHNEQLKSAIENKKYIKDHADKEKNKIYEEANVFFFDLDNVFSEVLSVADKVKYNTDTAFSVGYIGGKGELNIAPENVFNDGVHPTQENHAVFAMKLQEFIAQNLHSKVATTHSATL